MSGADNILSQYGVEAVWDDETQTLPKKVGTYSYGASYCADEVNYEVLEDITLSVNVVSATV